MAKKKPPFSTGQPVEVKPGNLFAGSRGTVLLCFSGLAGGWFVDFVQPGPPTHAANKLSRTKKRG